MRVDPKSAKPARTAEKAPAAKPSSDFRSVLQKGRDESPAATPAGPKPPAKALTRELPPEVALEASEGDAKPETPARPKREEPAPPTHWPVVELAPRMLSPVGQTAPTAAAAPVAPIERIADEVVLISRADGSREVQAEVDSKVIADLRISVTERDGRIEVKLLTDTTATQRQLEAALPQLSAALQARHLNVSTLQVAPRIQAFVPAQGRSSDSRQGRDGQGGRGGRDERGRR